jgi:3',5'-cyclic AMP phosphodiesterase CpdA
VRLVEGADTVIFGFCRYLAFQRWQCEGWRRLLAGNRLDSALDDRTPFTARFRGNGRLSRPQPSWPQQA